MHDIMCPGCGERYLARDVAFDFSAFVEPLIKDSYIIEDSQKFRFRYYIDEEDISKSADDFIYAEGGKLTNSGFVSFEVSCGTLAEYVGRFIDGDCTVFFDSICRAAQNRRRGDDAFGSERLNDLRNIYRKCFSGADGEFDGMRGENLCCELMLRLLCYIWENREKSIRTRVRLNITVYGDTHGAGVPDSLYALTEGGEVITMPKCCPCCHRQLAYDFGHYRSVFVGMLGEEKDSKKDFLRGLLSTVCDNVRPPFDASVNGFVVETLSSDPDLTALRSDNSSQQSILTLRTGSTLITFADIPDAAQTSDMIDAEALEEDNRRRKLICQCSHFVCFIPNGKLIPFANASRSGDTLSAELLRSFGKSVALSESAGYKTVKSVTVVINRLEKYRSIALANDVCELMKIYSEKDIFDREGWHNTAWEMINFKTKIFMIQYLNYFINRSLDMWKDFEPAFLGVSPEFEYEKQEDGVGTDQNVKDGEIGADAENNGAEKQTVIEKRPYMVGAVLLYVLRREGLLPDTRSDFKYAESTELYADL